MENATTQTWTTWAEASSHGWLRPDAAAGELHSGLEIRDISGRNSYGYTYAVCESLGAEQRPARHLLISKSICLTDEKNMMGNNGCYVAAFHVSEIRRLRAGARGLQNVLNAEIEELKQKLRALASSADDRDLSFPADLRAAIREAN